MLVSLQIHLVDEIRCKTTTNSMHQLTIFLLTGIPVRVSGENEKLMHNKFCLIDGTNAKGILITGSLNWTYGVS